MYQYNPVKSENSFLNYHKKPDFLQNIMRIHRLNLYVPCALVSGTSLDGRTKVHTMTIRALPPLSCRSTTPRNACRGETRGGRSTNRSPVSTGCRCTKSLHTFSMKINKGTGGMNIPGLIPFSLQRPILLRRCSQYLTHFFLKR